MPHPVAPLHRQNRVRSGVGGVIVVLLAAALLVACGDDGRAATGAAQRLIIETCHGRLDQRATGAAIGPTVIATVAHSLDGVSNIELRGANGRSQSAEVVYLDPGKDIALLRTEHPLAGHLDLARPEGPGPIGVLRHDDDDRPIIDRGELLELVDITLDGEGHRAAARLRADIEPGDSGAAVLDDDGNMVAMVFASGRDRDIGWAVSAVEIEAALGAMERGAKPPAC